MHFIVHNINAMSDVLPGGLNNMIIHMAQRLSEQCFDPNNTTKKKVVFRSKHIAQKMSSAEPPSSLLSEAGQIFHEQHLVKSALKSSIDATKLDANAESSESRQNIERILRQFSR